MLTVLLSAYNESKNTFFWKTLENIKALSDQGMKIEAIVGVAPGEDSTLSRLDEQDVKYTEVSGTKRACRYNRAFELSTGTKQEWIILNHPRSLLDQGAFHSLNTIHTANKWGAFTHRFDIDHPVLSFTSWYSNHVRGDLKKIFYLDHCLFIRREVFEKVGGVPEREIFEDTLLSLNLAEISCPLRLPWKSTTSAVRFTKNGILNQSLKNQILKWRFHLNDSDKRMNLDYEKGTDLNSQGWK